MTSVLAKVNRKLNISTKAKKFAHNIPIVVNLRSGKKVGEKDGLWNAQVGIS